MRRVKLTIFAVLALCFHGYNAAPVSETISVSTSTPRATVKGITTTDGVTPTSTDTAGEEGELSARFGIYGGYDRGGDHIFSGVGTKAFSGSKSSSSSFSQGGGSQYPSYPQQYPFPGYDSGPCRQPCGNNDDYPQYVPNYQPPQYQGKHNQFPGFGFNGGGSYSGSNSQASSFSNQNLGGGYYPGFNNGGSGSSASSSSFSGGIGPQGFPNGFGGPLNGAYSSSQASSSSFGKGGGGFSSSQSSSGSSSGIVGRMKPVEPENPSVSPEVDIPDANCRSSSC